MRRWAAVLIRCPTTKQQYAFYTTQGPYTGPHYYAAPRFEAILTNDAWTCGVPLDVWHRTIVASVGVCGAYVGGVGSSCLIDQYPMAAGSIWA